MSLKDTFKHLKTLLAEVLSDLDKSENGNKAASQRVRTGTIKLEKIAKLYRKESVKAEKSGSFKKPKAKSEKTKPAAKTKSAAKPASKPANKQALKPAAKPLAKSATKPAAKSPNGKPPAKPASKPQASAKPMGKAPTAKKPTAKIIKKKK